MPRWSADCWSADCWSADCWSADCWSTDRWSAEQIAERFEECVATLRKLPADRSLGYARCWPTLKHEPHELARQEAKPMRFFATADQITRMEETLTWITWIDPSERHLVWLRAHKTAWRVMARKTGLSKTSAQRHWHRALLKIANRLEEKQTPA